MRMNGDNSRVLQINHNSNPKDLLAQFSIECEYLFPEPMGAADAAARPERRRAPIPRNYGRFESTPRTRMKKERNKLGVSLGQPNGQNEQVSAAQNLPSGQRYNI
jgi:hypothetical protein